MHARRRGRVRHQRRRRQRFLRRCLPLLFSRDGHARLAHFDGERADERRGASSPPGRVWKGLGEKKKCALEATSGGEMALDFPPQAAAALGLWPASES